MRRTVSWAAEPRMSAGGERKLAAAVFAGAIIIARASAVAYRMHTYNLSSRPRFALGPFSFENCCYGGSQSGPHRGFTLGENAFEPLAGNPPGMGRAEAIAPTARAAPDFHALLRDTEQLRDLTGRIVVELEFHCALSINFGARRGPSCGGYHKMMW